MMFGLVTETRNDPEYVRNLAFWVRRLFDLTQYQFQSITSSQTIRITRTMYLVDASGGAVTVTLPTAKSAKGEWVTIKKVNSGSPNVTIDADGSETIDGATTKILTTHWDATKLISDGTAWYVAY